jgi:hypothetical protein
VVEADHVVNLREKVEGVGDEDASLVLECAADGLVEEVLANVGVDLRERKESAVGAKEEADVRLTAERGSSRRTTSAL